MGEDNDDALGDVEGEGRVSEVGDAEATSSTPAPVQSSSSDEVVSSAGASSASTPQLSGAAQAAEGVVEPVVVGNLAVLGPGNVTADGYAVVECDKLAEFGGCSCFWREVENGSLKTVIIPLSRAQDGEIGCIDPSEADNWEVSSTWPVSTFLSAEGRRG